MQESHVSPHHRDPETERGSAFERPRRVAVVGAGIAGLSAAWVLSRRHRVTLYEAGDYLGGHTHTVDVTLDGVTYPVDTGFLVFNHRTYPQLTRLFEYLGVPVARSQMSFSVSLSEPQVEWSGSSLATLFAQKTNLLRPDFLGMVRDIVRFNAETTRGDGELPDISLGDYLARHGYGRPFRDWYLLPMAAAIWSCPTRQMLDYPVATFVRFCHNHGLLQIFNRPQWLTVQGGGRQYVRRLAAGITDIRRSTPVRGLRRDAEGVRVDTDRGSERYDALVLACHSDQSLRLLGEGATADERALLGAVRYQPNRALLHTDTDLLPRHRGVWSAWNYLGGAGLPDERPVSVSYLIDRLQPLPFARPVIVSLNPFREPRPEAVIAEFEYDHPIFDAAAIAAQRRLPALQGANHTWFCGAWTGYGFHEDGLRSGLAVAAALGATAPWEGEAATLEAVA